VTAVTAYRRPRDIVGSMIVARLAAVLLVGAALVSAAQAEELTLTVTPLGGGPPLPATLLKPAAAGPFPAIVMMHDCSGLGPRSSGAPRRWADELVPQGYVVLIPDSFAPRGLPNGVCTVPAEQSRAANGYARAADAYGALAALRALPYVDGLRVGIMGGSHGGFTTLATLVAAMQDGPLVEARKNGFAAGLALYPRCDIRYGDWQVTRQNGNRGPMTGHSGVYKAVAPLLILTGEIDDWTPAEPCRVLVETGRAAGYPLEIKIYPGAHHSFDSNNQVRYVAERNNPNSLTGKGATTGGNPQAWADAKLQVRDFFARHLKPAP
jgi:dienelactone hydrolase